MNDNQTMVSAETSNKTNAILAWIFAPFTSYAWKDSNDKFLRKHARESFYFGVANIVVVLALWVIQFLFEVFVVNLIFANVYSLYGFSLLFTFVWNLVWLAVWIFAVVPRVIGIMNANSGETYTVPIVSDLGKKYLNLDKQDNNPA